MTKAQLKLNVDNDISNDNEWSNRGDYWLKKINPIPQYTARKRRIIHKPLILSGHGIKLNIDRDTLLIKCGFTHYPQTREEYRFFPNDRQLPSRIVILDGDGSLSFDALQWLSEQGVPLIQIDWQGHVSSIGNAYYASDTNLVKRQLEIQKQDNGFEFSKWVILQKIKNSYQTIKKISNNSDIAKPMLTKIKEQETKLKNKPPHNLASLLAIEGIAAAAYFRYWYTLPLKWRGLNRIHISPEWENIGTRIGNTRKSNQLANHPVNAILNYAYAILENQVRGYVVAAGLDPTIGYMHSNSKDRTSLIFDIMEPLRPVIDQYILEFVLSRTFAPDDFTLNKNGVCRLHPQFARYVVKLMHDIPEINTVTNKIIKQLIGKNIQINL